MNVPHRSDKNACDTAPVGHGLTIHLIALLLPIALLVMAGQFATNNYQNRSNAAEAAKIYTQAQVLLTAERIETILRATTVVVTSLRSFVIDEPDSRMLEPFVRDLLDQNKTILGIAVAIQSSGRGNRARYWYRNDNGLIVYREMDDAESAFHQAEWYAAPVASGKSEWTEPYFDAYGAETNMVTYSLPVFARNNENAALGVVTADLGLASLQDMVDKLAGGGGGFLLSRKGVYLGRSQKAHILPSTIFKDAAAIPSRRILGERMLRGESGMITSEATNKSQTWTAFVPIRETKWSLAVSYPMDTFLSGTDRQSAVLALEAFAGFLLLAGALMAVIWSVIHPMVVLTRAAQAVAGGDLASPIPHMRTRRDEVATLARAFGGMQRALRTYIEDLERATAARERIESELAIAKEIQFSLLPDTKADFAGRTDIDVAALMRPAREVGGDFYDAFLVDERRLCVVIADVSDKGVPAALYMSMTKTLLRAEALAESSADAILTRANRILARDNRTCMFVTVFCAMLDLVTGELCFANAGHNPPLLGGTDLSWRFMDVPHDFVLGPMPDSTYESRTIRLAPGDIILLYTDGITEARNAAGDLFGDNRLLQTLQGGESEAIATLLPRILTEIDVWAANCPQSDDITLLTVRYVGG